jgi:ribosomal protein S12 methylthiotransferase
MPNVFLINLGCAKNLVDSEHILGLINQEEGFDITGDPAGADIAIVNTCAFIRPAVEESIDTILEPWNAFWLSAVLYNDMGKSF